MPSVKRCVASLPSQAYRAHRARTNCGACM